MTKPILVLGSTGKTGSRIAQRLADGGLTARPGSRSATPAFDWEDESSWPKALDDVSAAYISYYPDIALPGALERVKRFIALALEKDVTRLVLLTGRGEVDAQRAEQALITSGARWTIVRASWFAQNFSEGLFAESIIAGTVHFPRDGVLEPFIDAEDIADVAAAALLDERHVGQLYEVTGPRLLTFRDALAEISKASGRSITYVPVTIEDYLAGLRAAGIPDAFVELLTILTTEVLDGRGSHIADGVMRALGRPPRDFTDYAARATAAHAWG